MNPVPKILIVEDSYFNQVLVESLLNSWGIETTTCKDAKAALKNLANEHFELVILDLMMPEMDGFEFLNHKHQLNDSTPVIVVSAKADKASIERTKDLGAVDFLVKPFRSETFKSLITKHLNQQKQ
ncbi:response regulator [Perlabentimonas gracilis]|uniref:response regulator n=1 Tax=Perlabentimonas gracilis TaxID=2715279 RepID=UPI00140DB9EF|nr:response regulator [Perlabentimonas gracilis]NHB69080.1 response regulator [Perlabentimonas gracilis]